MPINLDPEQDFVLNGNGHGITRFNINRPNEASVGMFKSLHARASVFNLTLSGSVIGGNGTGMLAGHSGSTEFALASDNGIIRNVDIIGKSSGPSIVSGTGVVGGLIGYGSFGTLENCDVTSLLVTGRTAGGLVGRHWWGAVSNSTISSSVTITGDYAGGAFGEFYANDPCSVGVSSYSGITSAATIVGFGFHHLAGFDSFHAEEGCESIEEEEEFPADHE